MDVWNWLIIYHIVLMELPHPLVNLLSAQIKTEFPFPKQSWNCFHLKFFHRRNKFHTYSAKSYSHFFNFILCSWNCGCRNVSVKPVNNELQAELLKPTFLFHRFLFLWSPVILFLYTAYDISTDNNVCHHICKCLWSTYLCAEFHIPSSSSSLVIINWKLKKIFA
jgi:hypothetical protein